MFSWHYSSHQSHNSKSFKTRHTSRQNTNDRNTKNMTANTVFTTSHTYISKHLLIQYGLLGANDLRLAELKSGAEDTKVNWGYIVRIPFFKYLPSQQSQQQRFILQINMISVECNESLCLLICNQFKNPSGKSFNLFLCILPS
jgi:hypothetical protein